MEGFRLAVQVDVDGLRARMAPPWQLVLLTPAELGAASLTALGLVVLGAIRANLQRRRGGGVRSLARSLGRDPKDEYAGKTADVTLGAGSRPS